MKYFRVCCVYAGCDPFFSCDYIHVTIGIMHLRYITINSIRVETGGLGSALWAPVLTRGNCWYRVGPVLSNLFSKN